MPRVGGEERLARGGDLVRAPEALERAELRLERVPVRRVVVQGEERVVERGLRVAGREARARAQGVERGVVRMQVGARLGRRARFGERALLEQLLDAPAPRSRIVPSAIRHGCGRYAAAARSRRMASTTGAQLPPCVWRKRRTPGYQGMRSPRIP